MIPKCVHLHCVTWLMFRFLKGGHCLQQPTGGEGGHGPHTYITLGRMVSFNKESVRHLPIFLMYQFFPPWDPFQYRAPTELTKAMTRRMPKSTRICTLVTFSTFDLLRGALVEFCTTARKASKGHRTHLGAKSREQRRWVNHIQHRKRKRLSFCQITNEIEKCTMRLNQQLVLNKEHRRHTVVFKGHISTLHDSVCTSYNYSPYFLILA